MPVEQRLEESNIKNENNRKKEYLRGSLCGPYRTGKESNPKDSGMV